MKKVMVEFFDITEDKHSTETKKVAQKLGVSIGGGCQSWISGTTGYHVSATGRGYLHTKCNGIGPVNCPEHKVWFNHMPGTGASGSHYCP